MAKLEDLRKGASVAGILPNVEAILIDVEWHGSEVVEVTFRNPDGQVASELLYRDSEPDLEVREPGAPWAFDSDGHLFKLASEAYRIRMAHLFDPWLAIHLSFIDPLPHQITAVYSDMLPRQPLRFLLADDPGAGKTIMTGLYIKELMLRGDLERCLIVAPGNLCEQWQDELDQKFQLPFEIMTNDRLEAARTGNAFAEMPLVVARLDKLSRDERLHPLLDATDWDLIVVDEAHKMSASVWGNEVKYTKRYQLGQLLSGTTRHLLLLTATPHNGKEEDFQLFLALIDGDRFAGRYREDMHTVDASDLFRRMSKEQLFKFDGTRLLPERRAYTVAYTLSDPEAALYHTVTGYIREEFNRAEVLEKDGRKRTVGFALTILQRRLASSPEAIFQSLQRRREKLEKRLREEKLLRRGAEARLDFPSSIPELDEEELDDLEDAPDVEFDETADMVLDHATASQTMYELQAEIETLKRLEKMAQDLRRSGVDTKWVELSALLQDNPQMFDSYGNRRKLVIFTEHKDTLNYLANRIRTLIGRPEAVVTISGGMARALRRRTQKAFVQDPQVYVLVATDAAGEGINLQRAHLMVNYDLPWNPARLEQRFGRIHRIGQTEVCHLWNLLASETREGDVYLRLLKKIEEQRRALGDGIFDILGRLLQGRKLRDLLIEAVRYGDNPKVRARLYETVDNLADQERCKDLLEDKALAHDTMDITQIQRIKEDFERAQARRLQPHFISSFFREAFIRIGGRINEREPNRYSISRVPAALRGRAFSGGHVLPRYDRVTFYKELVSVPGKPVADFLAPGHPLMDALIDLILQRFRGLLRRGAVLVDPDPEADAIRALIALEHTIQDGRQVSQGERRHVSRQMQFIEIDEHGGVTQAGAAPYLNYRPLEEKEKHLVHDLLAAAWLKGDLEAQASTYAIQHLVPQHLEEVAARREARVRKTRAAVKDRLTKEINHWDHRAAELKAKELAGKPAARLNSEMAHRRADALQTRLQSRMAELDLEEKHSALPPLVIGGAIVVPMRFLQAGEALSEPEPTLFARNRKLVEETAMEKVMEAEKKLGFDPKDVSAQNLGWDIESAIPGEGRLRFIEAKGRWDGAKTVTVTRNEILASLNKPEDYILAIVQVQIEGEGEDVQAEGTEPRYIRRPFKQEPDFAVTSVNFDLKKLIMRAEAPSRA